MFEQSVIGVYDSLETAEAAVRRLDAAGFPIAHVSIVAQDLQSEKQVQGYITTGDVAKQGVVGGAWMGGLFGLLIGAAFIWVPGFGPLMVAGPLAGMLVGTLEGATAGALSGGLLGVLVGWGVSRQHILKYEEHVKGGKYLVIAHGDGRQTTRAREILYQTDAEEINLHSDEPVRHTA